MVIGDEEWGWSLLVILLLLVMHAPQYAEVYRIMESHRARGKIVFKVSP